MVLRIRLKNLGRFGEILFMIFLYETSLKVIIVFVVFS